MDRSKRYKPFVQKSNEASVFLKRKATFADTAYFSHATPFGNVYELPLDNMACLRPDTSYAYNMPNAHHPTLLKPSYVQVGRMPGTDSKSPLVFAKKKK